METEYERVVLDLNDYKRKQKIVVEILLEISKEIPDSRADYGTAETERKAA